MYDKNNHLKDKMIRRNNNGY